MIQTVSNERLLAGQPFAADRILVEKGTYVLWLWLPQPTNLQVGALGMCTFPAGWYAYVGSAHGPGGLRGRLRHHLRPANRPHWHIDYFRAAADIQLVWFSVANRGLENRWARRLADHPWASIPVPRFGATDDTAPSHLIRFARRPALSWLA